MSVASRLAPHTIEALSVVGALGSTLFAVVLPRLHAGPSGSGAPIVP